MKALICAVFAAAIVAVPSLAFAQTTSAPVTRAEVRADLVRVEQAGYHPEENNLHYPADIQAAEARIHVAPGADHSYGGVQNDSASGAQPPAALIQGRTLYSGH